MLKIGFEILKDGAKVPTKGSDYAAGYDLYLPEDIEIEPGKVTTVDLGIAFHMIKTISIYPQIPYALLIYPRSGLGCKKGVTLVNTIPVIDQDYTGPIKLCLKIDPTRADQGTVKLKAGDRVAQMIVTPIYNAEFVDINEDGVETYVTERGAGGFGSTGH